MEDLSLTAQLGWLAFAAGLVFGGTAQKTNFCTMGAISDMVLMGDKNRWRAWLMAIAVAILGTQGLASVGIENEFGELMPLIDLEHTLVASDSEVAVGYRAANLGWAGAILGGLMFGYGMTRGGGCGNKTLVRIGGGNLKSLVVALVMGITAYMTLRGLIALGRVELEGATNLNLADSGLTSSGMDYLLAHFTGLDMSIARWIVAAILAGGFLVYCFKSRDFLSSPRDLAAGLIIGLLIPAGWYITGVMVRDEFDPLPLVSFTFVAPTAETIQYLMTFTGSTIDFGIAAVLGVIAGSFVMALLTRSFHWEAFSGVSDMGQTLFGAVLMGVGGVLALGCTIGQGLSGMSTLGLGSLIAFVSIVLGGILGMKTFEEGSFFGGLKAMLSRG